jgi:hypothetical protein
MDDKLHDDANDANGDCDDSPFFFFHFGCFLFVLIIVLLIMVCFANR